MQAGARTKREGYQKRDRRRGGGGGASSGAGGFRVSSPEASLRIELN